MRAQQISAMVSKPARCAALLFAVGSGNCISCTVRVPPSASLSSATACAVVPEPAKKSKTLASLGPPISTRYLIKRRSEERRVGKECRSQRARVEYKEKMDKKERHVENYA